MFKRPLSAATGKAPSAETEDGLAAAAMESTDRENEKRRLDLKQLYSQSHRLGDLSHSSLEQVNNAAVRIAAGQFGIKLATIWLYTEKTAELELAAHAGSHRAQLAGTTLSTQEDSPTRDHPASRALDRGTVEIFNDIENDHTFFNREEALECGLHACAAFPLSSRGKTQGALLIYSSAPGYFQEDAIRAFNALAVSVAESRDLTERELERQRAIDALQENERRVSTLMGNLPGAAYRARLDGKRTMEFISEGCLELTGHAPEAFAGSSEIFFGDLIHPEDRSHVQESISKAVESGKRFEMTYRIQPADGREKWIWERGQGIPSEDGVIRHIEGFMTDVTEKRRMESHALRSQRMESVGTLAGGIAHDLNNVLAPILMCTQLLKLTETDSRRMALLANLENIAHRGADMVRQILTFGRGAESQRSPLKFQMLINDITSLVEQTFPKNIQCSAFCPEDVWTGQGDPTQIHQVLLNLCVNARDAMPEGGTLLISMENIVVDAQFASMHAEATPGKYVVLKVNDTGTGIPPEIIDRIFDPFFTTKPLGQGTGLGLSTVLAIVKSHGGFVHLTSRVNEGTTFFIYLPASATPDSTAGGDAQSKTLTGNGELVMVVDDEESILFATQQTLEAHGYRVVTAHDGTEALSIFHTSSPKPAAVLTDMMMPHMDGPTLIATLLNMQPSLPIIGASGMSHTMQAQVNSLGVKHFLRKPYTIQSLLHALADVLAEQHLMQTTPVPRGAGELILVVEDERCVMDITVHILTEAGYRVETAVNGVEAVRWFQHARELPVVTFTDLMMPHMDGPHMIRNILKLHAGSKFIVTSGRPEAFPQEVARKLGVVEFLPKPCKAEHLLRALGKIAAEAHA